MNKIDLFGDGRDGLRIFALMLFPDSEDKVRQQWVSIQAVKKGKGVIEDLSVIVDSPSYTEIMEHTKIRLKQGLLAGTLMFHMYIMYKLGLSVSLNKAISVTQRWALEHQYADGGDIAYSDSSFFKFNTRFKPVVHIWAAFVCNIHFPFYEVSDESQEELFNGGLEEFLAASAEFMRFGVGFRAKNAKANYQNTTDAFSVPEEGLAQISLNLNYDSPKVQEIKNSYIR